MLSLSVASLLPRGWECSLPILQRVIVKVREDSKHSAQSLCCSHPCSKYHVHLCVSQGLETQQDLAASFLTSLPNRFPLPYPWPKSSDNGHSISLPDTEQLSCIRPIPVPCSCLQGPPDIPVTWVPLLAHFTDEATERLGGFAKSHRWQMAGLECQYR